MRKQTESRWKDREHRYRYDVIGVASGLMQGLVGSTDPVAEAEEMIDWLTWRIGPGWKEPSSEYDLLVRLYCRETLRLVVEKTAKRRSEHEQEG